MIFRLRFLPLFTVLAGFSAACALRAVAAEAKDISFGDLSFAVTPPKQVEPEGAVTPQPAYGDQIPARVRAFEGQRVRIRGFMMPTLLDGDGVREFIIVTSPMVCCYGQTPEVYEYILVRMVGKPAPIRENMPARYEGVLRVGDMYDKGYWTGLFSLECDGVIDG